MNICCVITCPTRLAQDCHKAAHKQDNQLHIRPFKYTLDDLRQSLK